MFATGSGHHRASRAGNPSRRRSSAGNESSLSSGSDSRSVTFMPAKVPLAHRRSCDRGKIQPEKRPSMLVISTDGKGSQADCASDPLKAWAWAMDQPKQRAQVLDIVLGKGTGQFSYLREPVFKTATKDFRRADFGRYLTPFHSDLDTLGRILQAAQALGTRSPLNIVESFIKQYPYIDYNATYSTLFKDKSVDIQETLVFLDSQFCGLRWLPLYDMYGGIASFKAGHARTRGCERTIVKIEPILTAPSDSDCPALTFTTYDGKNEILRFAQTDFEHEQDARILTKLVRRLRHASKCRDALEVRKRTAREFIISYPTIDIGTKRLVGKRDQNLQTFLP